MVEFAADWSAGRTADAATLTVDPGASRLLMTTVAGDLAALALTISTGQVQRSSDSAATVPATMTWTLPDAGDWTYQVTWQWKRSADGACWLLDFGPQSVHPGLGPGQTLAVRTEPAVDGPIVDRNDAVLISPVRVYSVVLLLGAVTDMKGTAQRLAALLQPIDPEVTARAVIAGAAAARSAGEASYTVTNLREEVFEPVEAQLTAIGGVSLPSQLRDLPPTPGFAATVLGSALPVAQQMTVGSPGWRVVSVDMAGDELATIADHPAQPGRKVTITLDPAVQDSAQAAVDRATLPAVLVAIEPGTGEILAVAQNAAADEQGPISLMGHYPPGSTFKIVTATAALDAGLITARKKVDCPGSWTADHHTIRNEGFALGTVTATTAFAHSCNTTFAALAARMAPDALPRAAAAYGIGLDFVIPGVTTLTGKIQDGETTLARAQNGFGQGTDLLTPFSAALMAATVAGGADMPIPTLIRGATTTVDRPAPPRSDQVRRTLPAMMRAVVTDGTAKLLQADGEVYAKTGTAEYVAADGEIAAHAWTVGFRGNVAFAVLIVGGGSSKNSNEIAHTFLSALPGS